LVSLHVLQQKSAPGYFSNLLHIEQQFDGVTDPEDPEHDVCELFPCDWPLVSLHVLQQKSAPGYFLYVLHLGQQSLTIIILLYTQCFVKKID
jgi:hypothetical protein